MPTDFSLKTFLRSIKRLLGLVQPVNALIITVLVLSVSASLFQLLGLGLLVPVLNGLVDPLHYEALLKTPRFSGLAEIAPFELTNKNIFIFLVGLALVSAYLENIFLYLAQLSSSKLIVTVSDRLRRLVYERYLGFGKQFFDRANLGELNVVIVNFVTSVGQLTHHLCQMCVLGSFALAFLAMMLLISWKLTIFAFILLPLTHFSSSWLSKKLKSSAQGEANQTVELSENSLNVLENATLVKLSGSQNQEVERFSETSQKIAKHGLNSRGRGFLIPRVVDSINTTGIMVLACGAVFLFFKGEAASIGRLSAFFISLRRFTSHLELLASSWAGCVGKVPHLQRVLWVFDDEDKYILEDLGAKEFKGIDEELVFKEVRFSYTEERKILKKVSFSAQRGSMTAIVGPTGAGKSSVLNLLPRFYDVDSGSIEIDGVDIRDFSLKSLRNRIALVSQQAMVFDASLRENLTYGLSVEAGLDEGEIEAALDAASLSEFIDSLPEGLETLVGKDGVQLSGGERQRLSIARAILRDPEILLLDEATSALDAETEAQIAQALDVLVEGKTVLVVAHRLSTIQRADKVIVLEDGKIIESGSPEELRESGGIFQKYCELQGVFH